MSSIWTPGGERPVGRDRPSAGAEGPDGDIQHDTQHGEGAEAEDLTPGEVEARMAELRDSLANTPARAVVANHCLGLFELAALHMSLQPPQLEEAQLAIDALGFLVEGLGDRLQDEGGQLAEGLAQLRLAFVQIRATHADQT